MEASPAEADSDEDDGAPARNALGGAAGARLLNLLGALSQHLGPDSRFANAAGRLQQDVAARRDGADEEESGAPVVDSTLHNPAVMSSMQMMLAVLGEGGVGTALTPQRQLFAALMPDDSPTPASPEAVQGLLDAQIDDELDPLPPPAQMQCAICLEQLGSDTHGCLRMACSHAFHRGCLLEWLDSSDTCPLCRDRLLEPSESSSQREPQM